MNTAIIDKAHDDVQLLKLMQQGDKRAFHHVFARYAGTCLKALRRDQHSRDRAHDLVLLVFVELWMLRIEVTDIEGFIMERTAALVSEGQANERRMA